MNRCVLLWTPNIGTRVELISKAWNSAITPTIIQNSFRHSGLYALSLQRALDAMGGRYDAGMEYAPPELLLEDSTAAFDIWGEVTPQVLTAQQFALHNDGIYIVNSAGSKGNVQCTSGTTAVMTNLNFYAHSGFYESSG